MAGLSTSGSAGAVATMVTLTAPHPNVRVINRGSVDLWVQTSGADAVVAGDDHFVVLAGQSEVVPVNLVANYDQGSGTNAPVTTSVSLIAASACPFTVLGK